MSDEHVIPVPEVEPEFKSTLTPEQLAEAEGLIAGRSFSGRNPQLGKMIKCTVCQLRHRAIQKCEPRFTNVAGDFEYFKEETDKETGETKLVPAYRTAVDAAVSAVGKPTKRSVVGAAAFNRKRVKPHHSKIKLLFIERVREVYEVWDKLFQANLGRLEAGQLRDDIEAFYDDPKNFATRLHRARILAARKVRASRESRDRKLRNIAKQSRRINRGS